MCNTNWLLVAAINFVLAVGNVCLLIALITRWRRHGRQERTFEAPWRPAIGETPLAGEFEAMARHEAVSLAADHFERPQRGCSLVYKETTEDYTEQQEDDAAKQVAEFARLALEPSPYEKITIDVIFEAYTVWCRLNDIIPVAGPDLLEELMLYYIEPMFGGWWDDSEGSTFTGVRIRFAIELVMSGQLNSGVIPVELLKNGGFIGANDEALDDSVGRSA